MKYEAVFGNQDLFDGAGTFTGLDVVTRSIASGNMMYCRLSDLTPQSLREYPVIAMRRIIQEPKRWTVEDQKAGRLPEVGCSVYSDLDKQPATVLCVDNESDIWFQCESGRVRCTDSYEISPLETPEEKAERLRSEWINKAYVDFHRLGCELEVLQKEQIKQIYDALLSGELTMPGKVDE